MTIKYETIRTCDRCGKTVEKLAKPGFCLRRSYSLWTAIFEAPYFSGTLEIVHLCIPCSKDLQDFFYDGKILD